MSHPDKCHTMTFFKMVKDLRYPFFVFLNDFDHSKDNNKLKTMLIKYHGM